jgi:hypothetical protein
MYQNSNNPAQFDEKVETVLLYQSDFPDTQQSGLGPLLMGNNLSRAAVLQHLRELMHYKWISSYNILLLGLLLLVENQFPHFILMPST